MSVLNIPQIQNRISTAHDEFIKAVGHMPDKLTADHQLILKRMATRIEAIMICFTNSNVISNWTSGYGDDDLSCYRFKLTKDGYDRAVYVWTDGITVSIARGNYPSSSGLNLDDGVVIRNIDFDNYNWLEFVDKLLHFIHKVTYARAKSFEAKIFG